jgi:general secretion pathway protein H
MPSSRQPGFTLIEILVVLIIVGLLASLAVVNLGGAQQQELRNTVRDMYLLMQTASEQAIVNNQELGLVFEDAGYRFVVFDDATRSWQVQTERLFRPRMLPEWLVLEQMIENDLPSLSGSDDESIRPDIVFFSSGEVTPFELGFAATAQAPVGHVIESEGFGGIHWHAPGDDPEGDAL